MRHINLTPECFDGLSMRMVTQESNNFGDQILTLKELIRENGKCYYKIISITSRCEGDWMSLDEMKSWSNNVKAINHAIGQG